MRYSTVTLLYTVAAMRKHMAAREVFHKIPANSVEVIQRNWKMKVCTRWCSLVVYQEVFIGSVLGGVNR